MTAVTYTHRIEDAKAYSTSALQNVIKQVVFIIEATDGKNVKSSFFTVELDDPSDKIFVEYEKLSKQHIYDWVVEKVGQTQIQSLENGLAAVLAEMNGSQELTLQPIALPN